MELTLTRNGSNTVSRLLTAEEDLAAKERNDQWQQRHDERFGGYTEEDWKQEHEMQRLEVLQIRTVERF